VRFDEILNSYLVDPPAGSSDGTAEPLSSLVPAREDPSFGTVAHSEAGLDCEAVYDAAGVPRDTPLTAEKALELIQRLPEDIPIGNRRVVVRMTMETMGATARDVLEDAAAKVWALDCYFRAACHDATEAAKDVQSRIDELQREINELVQAKKRHEARRAAVESSADSTIGGIRKVVEFFAIPASQASAQPAPAAPASPPAESPPDPEPATPATPYDPVRSPNAPAEDDLELPDLAPDGEQPGGFWEASKTHKSPDSADEMAGSFYTESGQVRRPNRKAA
jgi:hypothetical protein